MAFLRHWPCRSTAVVATALSWYAALHCHAQGESHASEAEIKAAFVASFPKYSQWPADMFGDAGGAIVVGALGENAVSREIQRAISGRTANGRPLIFRRISGPDDAAGLHVLFIPAEQQSRAASLLGGRKRGLLTVGDGDDFLQSGGIILMAKRNQKIALEINLGAARKAGISLSSKLLSVAHVTGN